MQLEQVLYEYAQNGKIEYETFTDAAYSNTVIWIGEKSYGVNDFLAKDSTTLNRADAQALLVTYLSEEIHEGDNLPEVTIKSTKTNPAKELQTTDKRNYTGYYILIGIAVLVAGFFITKKYFL
jgi:hypothetical protein